MNYTFAATYSECLEKLLDKLGAVEELRVDFINDHDGHVDVDVLLSDGRVVCCNYGYDGLGDQWEDCTDSEIMTQMLCDAIIFPNIEAYNDFLKKDSLPVADKQEEFDLQKAMEERNEFIKKHSFHTQNKINSLYKEPQEPFRI